MRIGIDVTSWFNPRGYGRFLRELLPELLAVGTPKHEFILYVESTGVGALSSFVGDHVRIHGVDVAVPPTEAAREDGNRSVFDMRRFSKAVDADDLDVVFFPTVYTYFPISRRQRAVVTIHDAIPEAFPRETLGGFKNRLFWRMKVRHAVRHARLVLTVSATARDEITARLRVPRDEIHVAVEAPSATFHADVSAAEITTAVEAIGLEGERFFLCVGGFNPHKLIPELIRRFAAIPPSSGAPHLVLAGDHQGDGFTGEVAAIRAVIEQEAMTDRVHFVGFVDDEALRALYAGAIALLLPSRMEGFGLSAVEAAACGTPVMATTVSPLPELLEGGGIFVSPDEPTTWTEAMVRLLDASERDPMASVARERAGSLSWSGAARATLDVLEKAAA